jgi:6-phosphogluconolactonase
MKVVGAENARLIEVYDSTEDLFIAVARRIALISEQSIAERGEFHLVLAGGETPRTCYEKLSLLPVDWAHVHIYFGDERCLTVNDARRNDTMVRAALLNRVIIPDYNIHVIPAELGAEKAALLYTQLLESVGQLDLVVLGMGEDGHTASLFPGQVENSALAIPVLDAPKFPAERVTMSMAMLNAIRQKIFLVAGAGKREALTRILRGERLPAASIVDAEWYLDSAAFPELDKPEPGMKCI